MAAESGAFSWIPFFEELADKLIAFSGRQQELIEFLEELRRQGLTITSLTDKDESGRRFVLSEIDPFTFLAVANRGLTNENRIQVLTEMRRFFEVGAPVPHDFTGIPVVSNQKSWFIAWAYQRLTGDVPALWHVFECALGADPLNDHEFLRAFDAALEVRNVNFNLTMGLFWVRPRQFLSLDSVMRQHLGVKIPAGGLASREYVAILRDVRAQHSEGFPALSHDAWLAISKPGVGSGSAGSVRPRPESASSPISSDINYWLVGAWWDDRDPADQTARFLEEGIWQNGFEDRLFDKVHQMKPGDRIAIKAAGTQKLGLPFENRGQTASKLVIKATGTIAKNRGDGRVVEVEWDPQFEERTWYFYTWRGTIWRLDQSNEMAQRLIRFVFQREPQDFAYFLNAWEGLKEREGPSSQGVGPTPEGAIRAVAPYAIEDALAEGVFMDREEFQGIVDRLRSKKNLILQGAPGVGKTFLARKLAYALMGERDTSRVESIQFHPSFSYEDFVRGYRPTRDAGRFELVDGPLQRLCQLASANPEVEHVLIIDEINRGNTSQIFGEFLALVEADKRGGIHGVTPLYRREANERFEVPENLYVIGTMNIADRSLALVDYALRRRFAFVTLVPRYGDSVFQEWLRARRMPVVMLRRIVDRMRELNDEISSDNLLGPAFRIGHSFFCPRGDDFSALDAKWFGDIVETEIIPLLQEYWFDAPEKVRNAADRLRVG